MKFKPGDFIIFENVRYFISNILDNEGDFIFLTNDNSDGKSDEIGDWGTYDRVLILTDEIVKDLENEMLNLNFKFFRILNPRVYDEIKIDTKFKIKNILNR